MLLNVKMPTINGILTFISRMKLCSAELSMIFITSGPGQPLLWPFGIELEVDVGIQLILNAHILTVTTRKHMGAWEGVL